MLNAVICFMEAKWVAGKFKPLAENGSTPHKTFAVFTYYGDIHDS